MSEISFQELGLDYVRVCLETYWGKCAFLLFFAAGLIFTLLFWKKERNSRIFLFYAVFLALTVYNPYLANILISKFHFENEYYRFLWVLPVIPAVAYYFVRLVYILPKKWMRIPTVCLLCFLIFVTGSPIEGVAKNFQMAQNIYKVPDALIAACDLIHKDSANEHPRVVFDASLNSIARQYDPSLGLVINRNASIYRAGSTVAGSFDENSKWYKRQKYIMDVVYYQSDEDLDTFKKTLVRTKTDYLVILAELGNHDFIREAGCELLTVIDQYAVYRFDWTVYAR